MHWYYEEKGKQAGPVHEHELRELVARQVVQAETLVWREGMADWQPLREAAPSILEGQSAGEQAPPVPPPPPMGWQGVQRGGRDERPQAVVYYRIYCWALVLLQLLMTAGGVLLLVFAEQMATQAPGTDPMEVRFQGGLMTIAGAVFLVPYLVAALLPERWWTWIAGLVIMALSLTSCCFLLPVTIPLLVYWVQPGTRAWFESLRGGPGR